MRAGDGSECGAKNVVGERVRAARETLGWSQAHLTARLAFVTAGAWNPAVQEVTHLETGRRTVLDVEVLALAQALKCSAAWLLTGAGRAEAQTAADTYGNPGAQRFRPGAAEPAPQSTQGEVPATGDQP